MAMASGTVLYQTPNIKRDKKQKMFFRSCLYNTSVDLYRPICMCFWPPVCLSTVWNLICLKKVKGKFKNWILCNTSNMAKVSGLSPDIRQSNYKPKIILRVGLYSTSLFCLPKKWKMTKFATVLARHMGKGKCFTTVSASNMGERKILCHSFRKAKMILRVGLYSNRQLK